MKTGKIIKSIAGFYEVHTGDALYRCRARGVFRALGVKPLVGDNVSMEVTDTVSVPMEGNVVSLLERSNTLTRPSVANVDQALLLFAVTSPDPSSNMIDRFLISVRHRGLPSVLCFNKTDLASDEQIASLRATYEKCGSRLLFISTQEEASLAPLREILRGRTTVVTGPSGAGKSTLINLLCPEAYMETGELSRKIRRGRNTTRHVELLRAGDNTWLIDTPGFTSLYLPEIETEELRTYYEEFAEYEGKCRFAPCMHAAEPDCAVRDAAMEGAFSRIRYENYLDLLEDLRSRKPVYRREPSRKEYSGKRPLGREEKGNTDEDDT